MKTIILLVLLGASVASAAAQDTCRSKIINGVLVSPGSVCDSLGRVVRPNPSPCPAKVMNGNGLEDWNRCDSLNAKEPWERLIFRVEIQIRSLNYFSPGDVAILLPEIHDLYVKYDFREQHDSTFRVSPPPPTYQSYEIGPYYMLKSTMDSILAEPYVDHVEYMSGFPSITAKLIPRMPFREHAGAAPPLFDAKGGRNGGRSLLLFPYRGK